MKTYKPFLTLAIGGALASAGLTQSVDAATIFTTTDSGNAAALDLDGAGTTTTLTLSAEDGGGTLDVTTIGAFVGATAKPLGMDANGMGVENAKWGNTNQRWLFSFDQTVDFDALGFIGGNHGMIIESTAWKDDTVTNGTNWSFSTDGNIGTISYNVNNGPAFDFIGAGLSSVAAGTQIEIRYVSGAGGAQMTNFTITAVPEPGSLALLGLGGLLIGARRRRNG